jgi:hypothetical protein
MDELLATKIKELSDEINTWMTHEEQRLEYSERPADPVLDFETTPLTEIILDCSKETNVISLRPYMYTIALVEYLRLAYPGVSWYLCRRVKLGHGSTDYYRVIRADILDVVFNQYLISRAKITVADCKIPCGQLANYLALITGTGRFALLDSSIFVHYCAARGNDIQYQLTYKMLLD